MSMDEREFRELMDACRAGSEDLHLAELEGLARLVEQDARVRTTLARSQRVDAEIRTAMQRVAVPDGLAGRILDRIAAEGSPLALPAAEHSAAVSLPSRRGSDREMRRRVRRPAWMAASVALASALVLAVILLRYYGPPKLDLITERSLSEDARRWAATLAPTRWKKPPFPSNAFPLSPHVPSPAQRWQTVSTQDPSDQLVCYDLSPAGAGRILLFVLVTKRRTENLPARPSVPVSDTQGLCVGVWEDKPHKTVYALAVEGGGKRYFALIGPRIASTSDRLGKRAPAA